MKSDSERATELAEAQVARQLGLDDEQVKKLLRPALEKCAKAASELIGEPVEASLEVLMSLGPEVMAEVQNILKQEFGKNQAKKSSASAPSAIDRAPKKNKFV